MGCRQNEPRKILEDNQSCISLSKNPAMHSRSKNIDIKHHFLREKVEYEEIKIVYFPTEEMVADAMTKPLAKDKFWKLRKEIPVVNLKCIC